MLNRKNITLAGLIVLVVLLITGFTAILETRFAEGGIYPHYASFRSDPLGTSVFYESLEAMEGVQVRRNITDLNSVKNLDADSVLLLLGYPRESFENLRAPDNSPVLAAVTNGARLVITMNPGLVPEVYRPEEDDWVERRSQLRDEASRKKMKRKKPKIETKEKDEPSDKDSDRSESEDDEDELEKLEKQVVAIDGPRLNKKLSFDIESLDDFERPKKGWRTRVGKDYQGIQPLKNPPRWRSQYRVELKADAWSEVLGATKKPVVIERKWGKGSIVFATDSFFASNEALHESGDAGFLVWLIGGKGDVVFDETIHGTRETGGAMKLIHRYRLHGFFLGMLVFVGLWAWRSASSLAPGSDVMDRGLIAGGAAVSGEHSRSGLVRLLRRSVPVKELLRRCAGVWQESQHRVLSDEVASQVESVIRESEAKPASTVLAYQKVSELLTRRCGQGVDKTAGKREEEASFKKEN
jgi:hypothetical protein